MKIGRDTFNKPYFIEYPEIYFNLSHCQGMVACIISNKQVGIDVEWIRPFHEGVMRKVCSIKEQQLIMQSTYPAETFFRLWTLKESYIKAIGQGLQSPMKEVTFSWKSDGEIRSNKGNLKFSQKIIDKRFIIAVCEEN